MLVLRSEQLEARILPEAGAGFAALIWLGEGGPQPVLQGGAGVAGDALFAMLPFANRAPGNQLSAPGTSVYALEPNTSEPLALHGIGWQRPWSVVEAKADRCRLRLVVGSAEYAFAFEAELVVALAGPTATIGLSLTNRHSRPIPIGLGFHPYFPRRVGTTLQFCADHFWLEGPEHLPTDPLCTPPELDFTAPRLLPRTWRNNAYSGWDGSAEVGQPDLGYRLLMRSSPNLADLMFYAPRDGDRFALEPQSHTSGATSAGAGDHGATGLFCVSPANRVASWVTLSVVSDFGTFLGTRGNTPSRQAE